jgi:PAS domain S-box-containing protein
VGGKLGYLQVANKKDGTLLDRDDIRLLTIICGQAATIIENATLLHQSQERAQRAEALRRIAILTGSVANLDEVLTFSVHELAKLLKADIGMIMLLNENRAELNLHSPSIYGMSESSASRLWRISMSDPDYRSTVTGSRKEIFTVNMDDDAEILPIYRSIVNRLRLKSFIDVPIVIREGGVGEILLGSHKKNHFDQNDLTMLVTAAGQLAATLEKSILYTQTDETLRRRVEQLLALTRVARELNTHLDLEHPLKLIFRELLGTTQSQCGMLAIFDLDKDPTEPLEILVRIGEATDNSLTSLEQFVINKEEPQTIHDYMHLIPDQIDRGIVPPHQDIRSSLIVPIRFREQVAGIIHLHSKEPGKYDETSLEIVQSMATQAAIAIGNAQRYQVQVQQTDLLRRRVETLEKLLDTSVYLLPDQPLDKALTAIAYGIQETTPFNVVIISVFNPLDQSISAIASVGTELEDHEGLHYQSKPWKSINQLLKADFRYGRTYFIPYDQKPIALPISYPQGRLKPLDIESGNNYQWHSDDLLLVPLTRANGEPLGLISVDDPRNSLRPDRPTIDSLEIFGSQAALTIENHQRQEELNKKAQEIEIELNTTRKTLQITQDQLPTLAQKDNDQADQANLLNIRVNRILASMQLIETTNQQVSRTEVLKILGEEILNHLEADNVLIAENNFGKPKLSYTFGELPGNEVNLDALFGQRNPLKATLSGAHPIYFPKLDAANEWHSAPLLQALDTQSFICLPIIVNGNINASVLITRHEPYKYFNQEDENLFSLVSRQVGVTLEHFQLLNETTRRLQELDQLLEFSRELGTLDPINILHSLLDSARRVVPSAQASFVALWDAQLQCLVPKVASGYKDDKRIFELLFKPGQGLPGQAYLEGKTQRIVEIDFAHQYDLSAETLVIYRFATGGLIPVSALCMPIISGEKKHGVLVLENFEETGAFSEEDDAIIASLTNQTALALENARLFQASEQRSLQLQTLTRVAGTITSSLQVDEIIDLLLAQIIEIIPYETGTLWLRQGEQMTIRAAHGFDDTDTRVGLSISVGESALLREMIVTNEPLYVGDISQDIRFPDLIQYRYLSWLGIPLLSKGEVIGVIALEKTEPNFYNSEHIKAVVTFAGQAAVALENANLYEESLRRLNELDDRSHRLALLNRLSAALSGSLDIDHILDVAIKELGQAIDCTAIVGVIFDASGKAFLTAQNPKIIEDLPIHLPDSALFDRLRISLGVFSTDNISKEDSLTSLRELLERYEAQSLLALPLVTADNLHGLFLLLHSQAHHFRTDEVELARTISNQVAVAVQNAHLFAETERLFSETRQISAELATLFDMGVNINQMLDQRKLIDTTFQNTLLMTHSDTIALVMVGNKNDLVLEAVDRGEKVGPTTYTRSGESLSEYILDVGRPLIIGDFETDREKLPTRGITIGEPIKSWLGVPLLIRGATVGVLSVQAYRDNAFGEAELRLLSQVGNQLAVALDNARLFEKVQTHAAELEDRVYKRTTELEKEHQRLQMLLDITTELSSSLDLDRVLNRTLAVVNESVGAEYSLVLLNQPNKPSLYTRASSGLVSSSNENALKLKKIGENLAKWAISNRHPLIIQDLHSDEVWSKEVDIELIFHSCTALPLIVGEEILGAFELFHRQRNYFTPGQHDLIQATANQIAVAINNAQLFRLIQDQAERLRETLRMQNVETSRTHAMLEAVADGVLVTDSSRTITLFNASAEQLLNLDRKQVVGKKLEHFSGLFGKQSHKWGQRIRTWSENPTAIEQGDLYDEQIYLDDGRVVSIHLSPVILKKDFLGTVSIFRDITHLIELDRLKSEFVGTVSHELRTPMTSIKGYVEILLMGAAGRLNEQQTHFLEIVKLNTERLAVLVNDLLDVSRIEAGRITLSSQPLDLSSLVKSATEMVRRRMQEENRPMEIQIDIPRRLHAAYGDQERVQQIFENLLENAYQYTPDNGLIQVQIYEANGEIQVNIKDNGIGIYPDDLERIFERFYRGEDPLVLATSGTGLGLSIVKHLVEMHGGRIWANSTGISGEGSTFSFTLPIYNPIKMPEITKEAA